MAKKQKGKKTKHNNNTTVNPSIQDNITQNLPEQMNNSIIDSMNDIFQKNKILDDDLKSLAVYVNQHDAALLEKPDTQAFQHGVMTPLAAVDYLQKIRVDKVFYAECMQKIAEHWQKEYEIIHTKSHNDRREALERIIRLLKPLAEQEDISPHLLLSLSQAYYHRGLLFRPKEFQVPSRKIEACNLALDYCDRALSCVSNDENTIKMAVTKIWLLAYKELERIQKHGSRKKHYQNYITTYVMQKRVDDLNDIAIYLDYTKNCQNEEKQQFKEIIDTFLSKNQSHRPFDSSLCRARLAFYHNQMIKMIRHAKKSIKKAPRSFADPYWDALIAFINEVKVAQSEEWKDIAICAWEKCCEQTETVGNNVHLCWYWSNQRELYDMAFSAQTDPEQKARVADSIKSRSTLVLHAMNDLKKFAHEKGDDLTKQHIQQMINQFSNARDNNYLKTITNLNEISTPKIQSYITNLEPGTEEDLLSKSKSVTFSQDIPKGFTVIHLYLNEMKKKGYAIIKTKKIPWLCFKFNYLSLYQKFLEWQENYLNKTNPSQSLINLCQEIGKSMKDFLFSKQAPITKNVIWIPHGFLHRLPLHAAINPKNNTYFFTNHVSRYLPAWHLYQPRINTNESHNNSGEVSKNLKKDYALVQHFPYDFKKIYKETGCHKNDSTSGHLIEVMSQNPKNLILLCHGSCDSSNSFRSHLMLSDGNLTIYDIAMNQHDLVDSQIFLGACESDMVPPIRLSVDEHFTISAAFLLQNVSDIVSTLWKVDSEVIDRCYSKMIKQKQPVEKTLQEFQKKECKQEEALYRVAPIKVIGVPENNNTSRWSLNFISEILKFRIS